MRGKEKYTKHPSFIEFLREEEPLTKKIIQIRNEMSPEKEYLLGATATVVYCATLLSPDTFPETMKQTLSFLRETLPGYEATLVAATAVATGITVDGARRISKESLPFYKAWAQSTLEDLYSFAPRKK